MKITLTGGSGFLGAHVADVLAKKGHLVFIFDKKKPKRLIKKQYYIKGDVTKIKSLEKAIKKSDIVYHFAGISDLDEALNKPVETVNQNILGTVNVLELTKKYKIKRLVYASSVYATSIQGGFYSCSKKTAESYIEEYYKRYKTSFTILRYGSLYGLGSDERNGIYTILKDAINKNKFQYIGNKLAVRKYIHVKDAAEASVSILSKKYKNKHVNIVGIKNYKITELFRIISKLLKKNNKVIFKNKKHLGHYVKSPKSFKISAGLNFKLKNNINLKEGIGSLIENEKF